MRWRDRYTGRFVPASFAKSHPDRTVPVRYREPGATPQSRSRKVEYEITATTRGGTPRKRPQTGGRKVDQRVLQLKIRITAPEGTIRSEEDAMRLISKAKRGISLPPGVQVQWIDWRKGTGGRATAGMVERRDVQDALGLFWAALTSGRARIEMGR
jgi:hypothetical protein